MWRPGLLFLFSDKWHYDQNVKFFLKADTVFGINQLTYIDQISKGTQSLCYFFTLKGLYYAKFMSEDIKTYSTYLSLSNPVCWGIELLKS